METASRFAAQHRVALAGSEKKPFAAGAVTAKTTIADPSMAGEEITVSVIVAP